MCREGCILLKGQPGTPNASSAIVWSACRSLVFVSLSCAQTLAEEVTVIEQTDDHGFLQSCADALGSTKLLRHRDADVKC